MNKEIFDGLSPDIQKALKDVGSSIADYYGQRMNNENETALKDMQAGINGKTIEVLELAKADRQKMVATGERYINDWVQNANKSGLEGERMLNRIKGLVAKYRKQRDEQGYPWAK